MKTLPPLTFHHTFRDGRAIELRMLRKENEAPTIEIPETYDMTGLEQEYVEWSRTVFSEAVETLLTDGERAALFVVGLGKLS